MKIETEEDDFRWICPECGTVYYGWAKNTSPCPKCGYMEQEKDRQDSIFTVV
ncbi:MAG: hypothetical protein ACE5IH_03015 [Thermodesulfobacteriota bacterium]